MFPSSATFYDDAQNPAHLTEAYLSTGKRATSCKIDGICEWEYKGSRANTSVRSRKPAEVIEIFQSMHYLFDMVIAESLNNESPWTNSSWDQNPDGRTN